MNEQEISIDIDRQDLEQLELWKNRIETEIRFLNGIEQRLYKLVLRQTDWVTLIASLIAIGLASILLIIVCMEHI
jgi:hypothetical protein